MRSQVEADDRTLGIPFRQSPDETVPHLTTGTGHQHGGATIGMGCFGPGEVGSVN